MIGNRCAEGYEMATIAEEHIEPAAMYFAISNMGQEHWLNDVKEPEDIRLIYQELDAVFQTKCDISLKDEYEYWLKACKAQGDYVVAEWRKSLARWMQS